MTLQSTTLVPDIPTVSGPIMGPGQPLGVASFDNALGSIDLARFGYVEEEFFISGTSAIYEWPSLESGVQFERTGVPYTARVLVRRPADSSKFSGNAVVEPWHHNFRFDRSGAWARSAREYFLNRGDVWAAVTISPVCIEALNRYFDPKRYATLSLEDLGQAWDILGQVGRLLKSSESDGNPLKATPAKRLYMTQVGFDTWTYINGFSMLHRMPDDSPVYDGFVPMGGGREPTRINSKASAVPTGDPRRIIQPRDAAIISVMTEGEASRYILVGSLRRPDGDDPSDRFRLWEVPGTAHGGFGFGGTGLGDEPSYLQLRGKHPDLRDLSAPPPDDTSNDFPQYMPAHAAWESLKRWVEEGVAPPHVGPNEMAADGDGFARDEHGNAVGGWRSPYLDVPVATYESGLGTGPQPTGKTAFTKAKLKALYGSHDGYVERVARRTEELVAQRLLLAEDGETIKAEAVANAKFF